MHPLRPRRKLFTVVGAASLGLAIGYPLATNATTSSPSASGVNHYNAAVLAQGDASVPDAARIKLERLEGTHGVSIDVAAARVLQAPAGDPSGEPWVVAPTTAGGLCTITARLTFCGVTADDVISGTAAASEFKPDTLIRFDRKSGRVHTKPSREDGHRSGIAPPAATRIVVRDSRGALVHETAVQHGLYSTAVPPQGSGATVTFEDSTGRTLATRPTEG